jgi:hypothetical protein
MPATMNTKETAQTIIGQISRNTKMCVAAREYVCGPAGLTFRVTLFRNQRHWIRVSLEANDTYTVSLLRMKTTRTKVVGGELVLGTQEAVVEKTVDLVYCDQLDELVYQLCTPRS